MRTDNWKPCVCDGPKCTCGAVESWPIPYATDCPEYIPGAGYIGWRHWYAIRCKIVGLMEAAKLLCDCIQMHTCDSTYQYQINKRVEFYLEEARKINEKYKQNYPDTLDGMLAEDLGDKDD